MSLIERFHCTVSVVVTDPAIDSKGWMMVGFNNSNVCLPAAPETRDAIDGSSAVTSTTSVVVTDPAIDSRGRMCCNKYITFIECCCVCLSVSMQG